jgi:hypothetical protein
MPSSLFALFLYGFVFSHAVSDREGNPSCQSMIQNEMNING